MRVGLFAAAVRHCVCSASRKWTLPCRVSGKAGGRPGCSYGCFSQQLRRISLSTGSLHGGFEWKDATCEDEVVNVTYIEKDGKEHKVRGKIGDNVLYLAHRYEIPMEGACEASLACTTCHVYVDDDHFDKLAEPDEKEEDLLDMAPFLKPNSRLGCQIVLRKDLDGIVLRLPQATRNFYVDGHVPQPH